MLRRQVLALMAIVLMPAAAWAEDIKLTAGEISTLLTGNTISGTWVGVPYTSTYSPDGVTVYTEEGRPAQRGRWRVNEQTDEYESWWEQSGWSGYVIVRSDEGLAWLFKGTRQPFVVIDGIAAN